MTRRVVGWLIGAAAWVALGWLLFRWAAQP